MGVVNLSRDDAFLVLNALPHVGPVTLQRLMEGFGGDPLKILGASAKALEGVRDVGPVIAQTLTGWSVHVDIAAQRAKLAQSGVRFLCRETESYPVLLRELYDAPIGLYWKGLEMPQGPCVAFVGTRRATLYGTGVAKRLARELAGHGYGIISGMARGIDTAAHQGALEVGGWTAAVLGCGIDIVYPPENYELYQNMSERGALISEFPFGRRADRQTFPMRNRIIAGMCQGVVIVESGLSGGAMITARFAGEQGRQVFAVPGRVDQEASQGCHALIRDGATLVSCVEDILEELEVGRQRELLFNEVEAARALPEGLSDDEQIVLEHLRAVAMASPDELSVAVKLPINRVGAALLMLELKHHAAKRADGCYEAV